VVAASFLRHYKYPAERQGYVEVIAAVGEKAPLFSSNGSFEDGMVG